MSGSPIIQDGKPVGAVTHVPVNDPHRGTGFYREYAGSGRIDDLTGAICPCLFDVIYAKISLVIKKRVIICQK